MCGIRRFLISLAIGLGCVPTGLAQTPATTAFAGGSAGSISPDWATSRHNTFSRDTLEDRNGSLLVGDPLLDGCNRVGWFGTVDLDILASHVHSELSAPVAVGPITSTVTLPMANLNWTVSPRFEVGYRFGKALGEFLVSYRFVSTSGSSSIAGFDPAGNPASLRSRFDMNVIDLDYGSRENSLLPLLDMKWRVGVRMAGLFFDSEATSALLERHVDNYFFGAGPHVMLDLSCPLVERQFGLFTRIDAAGVVGRVQQGFAETDVLAGGPVSGFTRQSQIVPTTMLNVQAGAEWSPRESWRLSAGYTYEHWWDATFTGTSRGDVWTQGLFLRAEWKF